MRSVEYAEESLLKLSQKLKVRFQIILGIVQREQELYLTLQLLTISILTTRDCMPGESLATSIGMHIALNIILKRLMSKLSKSYKISKNLLRSKMKNAIHLFSGNTYST